MSNEQDKNIRVIGGVKIVAGLIMLPLTFILVFIGMIVKMLGLFALVAGILAKIASVISTEHQKKQFWLERARKLASFGTMGLISGLSLCVPLMPGVILLFEGIYNAIAADSSYGVWPVLKASGNLATDLTNNIYKNCKAPEEKAAPKKKEVAVKAETKAKEVKKVAATTKPKAKETKKVTASKPKAKAKTAPKKKA